MKFTLTYDGELRANARPSHKQFIREQLGPQLEELWRVSLALQYVRKHRWVATRGSFGIRTLHHSVDVDDFSDAPPPAPGDWIDTLKDVEVCGHHFVPLVRDSLALFCGLKILYMRKEEPGRLVYQGGDIDNRLKTLFDALSVPNKDQVAQAPPAASPLYCLLEDDRLVSGVAVETQRLLGQPEANQHVVRLVIEVDIRVTQARLYNLPFLGD
jgi:hypothetical protein